MADDVVVSEVRSYSFGVPGRALNQARENHWVIDSSSAPETVSTVESFLAGISACGVTLIDGLARADGLPLSHTEVTISGVRRVADPTVLHEVNMRFVLSGVTQDQAVGLVDRYRGR